MPHIDDASNPHMLRDFFQALLEQQPLPIMDPTEQNRAGDLTLATDMLRSNML